MNAVLFIRASTKEQSTDIQIKACQKYAKEHKYVVTKVISKNQSGYKTSYEESLVGFFSSLIKDHPHHIIVWSVDRLARNLMAFSKLMDYLYRRQPNITFHFISENRQIKVKDFFPASSEACEIFELINAGQTSSAVLSRKIRSSRTIAKANFVNPYFGGAIPLGKTVEIRDNQKVLVDDPEQLHLAQLVIYLAQDDDFDCSSDLNFRGIYCPFFVKGKKEYRLWTKKDCIRYSDLGQRGRMPPEYEVFFENELMETSDEEQITVLDTMIYKRKEYSKVLWKNTKANGEPDICWIESNHIKTQ